MEVSRLVGNVCFVVTMFLLTVLLSACSMQSSGSKLESARTDQNHKAASNLSQQNASRENGGLRVDYLTPLADIRAPEVYVYKEKRRLYVVQSNVLVRDYPVGLGLVPQGDKEKDGDGRTPEGEFVICDKNAVSPWGKLLGLNYPVKKHAERAFFAGVLSPAEFKDILAASESKDKPPWNTALGGEVSIHSGGAHKDWTDGSVALYNSDMEELFRIAGIGTPVSIRP